MFKLASIFRVDGGEYGNNLREGRPKWFNKQITWFSFYRQLSPYSDIFVVWDGPKNELFDYISGFASIHIQEINLRSNKGSLLECIKLAEVLDCTHLYFSESDWLYFQDAGRVLVEGLKFPIFQDHFVSLYDRPHAYFWPCDDVSFGCDFVFRTGTTHFRSTESTMWSFGLNKEFFLTIKDTLIKYANNPICDSPVDREMFRFFYKQGIRVFNPIPGKATHCINFDLSPGIDYNKEIELLKNES